MIADELCAPELRQHELERIAGDSSQYVDGWMKQQLVKLACSFAISTPFYLITDADMFFLHDVGALDLIEQKECTEASGVCDTDKAIAFRALNEMQPPEIGEAQRSWISSSAATLNVSRKQAYFVQTCALVDSHYCTICTSLRGYPHCCVPADDARVALVSDERAQRTLQDDGCNTSDTEPLNHGSIGQAYPA